MQKLFTLLALLFLSLSVYSQIPSAGAMIYYPNQGRGGFGFTFDYPQSYKNVLAGSLRIHFDSRENDIRATATDTLVSPSSIQIPVTTTVTFTGVKAGIKRYFKGDYDDAPAFYISAKAGISIQSIRRRIDSYDTASYNPSSTIPDIKESLFAPSIGLGIGGEWNIKFGYFFVELEADFLLYSVQTFQNNGLLGTTNLGVRVPLDIFD